MASLSQSRPQLALRGSRVHRSLMLRIKHRCEDTGIHCVLPLENTGLTGDAALEEHARAHLAQIRDPRTFAVLAVNVDQDGIRDYIGPTTFADLAVAFSAAKRIYVLNGLPSVFRDALLIFEATPLAGSLDRLIQDCQQWQRDHTPE